MIFYSYEFLITGIIDLSIYESLRNVLIIPIMVGKEYEVLNGRNKYKILVNRKMIGFKLGEFIFNRSIGDIHVKKKQKKKQGKKKK